MRIAFLPSSYLPESLGGTEMYVHHLAQGLTTRGHDVAVVYHSDHTGATEDEGYRVQRLPPHLPTRRADLYCRATGQSPPGFTDFLAHWQPDVVHFHAFTLGAGLDHARALRQRGVPYFITYHTPTFSCQRGTLLHWGSTVCDGRLDVHRCASCSLHAHGFSRPMARLLGLSPLSCRLPDGPWIARLALPSLLGQATHCWHEFMGGAAHIVACADWCRDVLLANNVAAEKISTHRQALPGAERLRQLRLPLAKRAPLRLGFFGRVTWVKGPDLFVHALTTLNQLGVAALGEMVGPCAEDERGALENLAGASNGRASYLGAKRGAELTAWLDTLDLVVIPSRWLETGPLTLLEAWDRGVPVIGTSLGGIRDFMAAAGMDDLLFPSEEPTAIAAAVVRAMEWPADRPREVAVNGMEQLTGAMEAMYRNGRGTGFLPPSR